MPYTPGTLQPRQLGRLAEQAADPEAAKKVAKDFESVLLHKVMEQMHRTVGDSGLLSDGTSRQVQGLFWFQLAQEVAANGGLGLWKEIYRHLTGVEAAAAQRPEPPR
jgi:Rod binding domain-containing protein